MTQPGDGLRTLAARVCDARTMERVIEPMVADLQHEYAEARRRQQVWRGRWILVRGRLTLAKVLAIQGSGLVARVCVATDAAEANARRRALRCGLLVTTLATAVFMWPLLSAAGTAGAAEATGAAAAAGAARASAHASRLTLAAYALPSALVTALVCGFLLGVLYGCGGILHARRRVGLVLAAAVICSITSYVAITWIVPVSNYAYRVAIAGQDVPRGVNELTTSELRERLASDVAEPIRAGGQRGDRRFVAVMYHTRAAFSCAALLLSLLALPMLSWRRDRRLTLGVMMYVAYVGYFFWLTGSGGLDGRLATLSPAAVAWLPNYLLAFVAIIWLSSRVRWSRGRSVLDRRG